MQRDRLEDASPQCRNPVLPPPAGLAKLGAFTALFALFHLCSYTLPAAISRVSLQTLALSPSEGCCDPARDRRRQGLYLVMPV